MRRWVSKKDIETVRDLIVIPDKMIESVMELHHKSETCHPGIDQSIELCRRHFYWPKMQDEFKEYIKAWGGVRLTFSTFSTSIFGKKSSNVEKCRKCRKIIRGNFHVNNRQYGR